MAHLTEADALAAPARTGRREPIDAETLIQWAMDQTGYLPWRGVTDRELMFDHGYNAIPKNVPTTYQGSQPLLRAAVSDDATLVIAAIKALPPRTAAMVIACGREKIRPECFVDFEPAQVAKTIYPRRKRKRGKRSKGHRPYTVVVWNIDPEVICASREAYERWHRAVEDVAAQVAALVTRWRIKGFAAPHRPWERSSTQIQLTGGKSMPPLPTATSNA
jgi:hypothetical protein